MQRQIKFRFWDLKNNIWVKQMGLYDDGLIGDFSECFHNIAGKNGEYFVAQQFTGLQDKNGRDIYEGDIIKTDDEILLVEYCEEYAKFGAIIYLQDGVEPENSVWHWGEDLFHVYGEVIGNIFENKELLS